MIKLIRSDFRRLWRSKAFYFGLLVMGILAVWGVFSRYYYTNSQMEPGYDAPDDILFSALQYIPFVIAVFVSLFVCTDYSDGTIRNKLVVGHRKISIYVSYVIVTSVASLLMHIFYTLSVVGLSIPLLNDFETPAYINLTVFLCSIVLVIALNSIAVLLSGLFRNRVVCLVASLLLMYLLFELSGSIYGGLINPEFIGGYTYTINGEIFEMPLIRNQYYVSGTKRVIYEFLNEFLPHGQTFLFSQSLTELPENIWLKPIYSAVCILITSIGGAWVFKRSEFK